MEDKGLHTTLKMHTCKIICDIVSLRDAVAMAINAQFDLLEANVAIWVLDYWQVN